MQDFLSRRLQITGMGLLMVSLFPNLGLAADPAAPAPAGLAAPATNSSKKGFNTQIYEKEEAATFSDQVRITREMAGEFQVFFKNHPGVYRLSETSSDQALLVKAQKNGMKITVTVETESRMILKVLEKE